MACCICLQEGEVQSEAQVSIVTVVSLTFCVLCSPVSYLH